jgi:hypothetical protein
MQKHTPAPWTVTTTQFAGGEAIYVEPVAIVLGHGQTPAANAKVIAAAPQMLAMLQSIAGMTTYTIDSSDDALEDAVATMNSLIDNARQFLKFV